MPILSHPTRGRCHETSCWRGGMRRLRAGLVTRPREASGRRQAPTARELRFDGWTARPRRREGAAAKSRRDRVEPKAARGPAPGSTAPAEQKSPPWSAERRPRSPKGNAAKTEDWCAAWRSTPSGLPEGKEGPAKAEATAYPGRKESGDDAWLAPSFRDASDKRVYARLRRAMATNPESRDAGTACPRSGRQRAILE